MFGRKKTGKTPKAEKSIKTEKTVEIDKNKKAKIDKIAKIDKSVKKEGSEKLNKRYQKNKDPDSDLKLDYQSLDKNLDPLDQSDEISDSAFYELETVTLELPGKEDVTKDLGRKKNAARPPQKKRWRVRVGTSSVIGSRKSQQDSVFGYESKGWALGIVCDGMGGLCGGDVASRVALQSVADAWFEKKDSMRNIPDFFRREAILADQKVYGQTSPEGERLNAGTTIVAALIQEKGLYWLSVGDSKLYFIRGKEIVSLNVEHNYRLELNERLRQGKMTAKEYAAEEYRAEALTSYLGIGELTKMDINQKAYPLKNGDIILLTSDGLYRSLLEEEILSIVNANRHNMQQAADALTAAVKGRKKQDNTSVVILHYIMENAL